MAASRASCRRDHESGIISGTNQHPTRDACGHEVGHSTRRVWGGGVAEKHVGNGPKQLCRIAYTTMLTSIVSLLELVGPPNSAPSS